MVVPLTLAHSPDPDDAFMWWPLIALNGQPPALDTGRFRFQTVAADIEILNEHAEQGRYDITALSCAHWGRVADRYALTACGASVGDGYGPKLVARGPVAPGTLDSLRRPDAVVAVPGTRTTAFMVTSLLLGPGSFRHEVAPFHEIIDRVVSGRVAAGVVIHEAQLTFERAGLSLVQDLGAWWHRRTGLPLPLGANAIKRDLDQRFGPGTIDQATALLAASVAHSLSHRRQSLDYARGFARGLDDETIDAFVSKYVNRWTLDYGARGREAVRRLLDEAAAAGLAPRVASLDVVDVAGRP